MDNAYAYDVVNALMLIGLGFGCVSLYKSNRELRAENERLRAARDEYFADWDARPLDLRKLERVRR